MPQRALLKKWGIDDRDAPVIAIKKEFHKLTRTWGARGRKTAKEDANSDFWKVLQKDIDDLRNIAGNRYDKGIEELVQWWERILK